MVFAAINLGWFRRSPRVPLSDQAEYLRMILLENGIVRLGQIRMELNVHRDIRFPPTGYPALPTDLLILETFHQALMRKGGKKYHLRMIAQRHRGRKTQSLLHRIYSTRCHYGCLNGFLYVGHLTPSEHSRTTE